MFTGIAIIVMFAVTGGLVFIEKFLGRYKLPIYIVIGVLIILLAGLREVGIDPDSENYEQAYRNYYTTAASEGVEFSYILISSILNIFSNDVHLLFLCYAFAGVCLKFIAFRYYSDLWFLPVLVYLGFYYELHEMTQIRTGVLSGLFLLSIKYLAEGKKLAYILFIAVGAFFHISALLLLPFMFFSNRSISFTSSLFWALLIPFGYFIYFFSSTILIQIDLPYIGTKLATYQAAAEKGISQIQINVFSPRQLFTTLIYFYLLYFRDTITVFNKYFPIMLKISAVGLLSFTVLGFLPVLAERVSYLFLIVNIVLISNIYYTLKPTWAGNLLVILIAFVYLNYSLPYVSFHLFWKG